MTRAPALTEYPWRLWSRQVATVTRMELRKTLFRWRGVWLYLLALAPVVIIGGHAFFDRHQNDRLNEDVQVLAGIFQFYYLRVAIFFGCLGLFTRLIRGEMVERSLHYYLLSPVRRELLIVGKFLAGAITAIFVFGTAIFLSTALMYLHHGAKGMQYLTEGAGGYHMKAYLGIMALACLGYGAVFLALSMMFKNPIVPGMVLFGWEALNPILPELMQKASVIYYLRHLVPVSIPAEGFFALLTVVTEPVPAWVATVGVIGVTLAVLIFACYRVRSLEISYTTD